MLSRTLTRTCVVGAAVLTLDYHVNRKNQGLVRCAAATASAIESLPHFDSKGFSMKFIPPNILGKASQPLYLTGVGMRRKNFYIVEVDVYLTALCLSPPALERGRLAAHQHKSLAEEILSAPRTQSGGIPEAAVILKFVRNVTTNQIVEAFNDAFVGCDQASIDQFKNLLRDSIGLDGMPKGNEIVFCWLQGGGLAVSKNGICGEVMKSPEIEKRLLEVYVDPSRAVSPQLVESIQGNLTNN